jgi:hypothetical protein
MSYVFEGIALTSIDVVDSPTPECPNRVVFSASTPGRKDDTTATFIHKVKDVDSSNKDEVGLLEAEKILPSQVQSIINGDSSDEREKSTAVEDKDSNRKVLFSVHGFMGDPRGYLLQVKGIEERFQKFKLIPVLWPSAGIMLGYYRDRDLSKGAGKAFQSIVEPMGSFSKSILCHSMGNRVLRNFANPSFNFDNIFMAAPDVNSDLFNESYIEGGKEEWRKDGLRIKDMLTDKGGKIHILFNRNDMDLLLSTVANMGSRLGRSGPSPGGCFGNQDTFHEDVKDKICTADWTHSSPSHSHCYQFDWSTAAYCDSHYN